MDIYNKIPKESTTEQSQNFVSLHRDLRNGLDRMGDSNYNGFNSQFSHVAYAFVPSTSAQPSEQRKITFGKYEIVKRKRVTIVSRYNSQGQSESSCRITQTQISGRISFEQNN